MSMSSGLIHAVEDPAEELDLVILEHHAVQDIGFADEVRHEGVLRLVVDVLGSADLLDPALVHDHHGIGHGEGLLLVVGDVDEGDAGGALDPLQLVLHILAQAQVKSRQRLVQQQYLGLVHQGTGDSDALLLTAGEVVDAAVLVALQADDLQHLMDPAVDLVLGQLRHLQAEGDIIIHIQMREQGIPLENGVDLPSVGGQIVDDLAVKGHCAAGRREEATDDTKRGGLAAAGGAQQC